VSAAAPYDDLPVRVARARYFEDNEFGADGGYGAKWVTLKLGPLPLAFPNTAARIAAVKLHDLHHVVTGYATTPTGEAEIGAWEVASGCGRYTAAWMLNLWAMSYGTWLAPRALFRAFVRGRHSGNLYHGATLDDALLDRSVSDLRAQLHVPMEPVRVATDDGIAFVAWSVAAALWGLASLGLLAALAVSLVRLAF
jgi:hypothetical protein